MLQFVQVTTAGVPVVFVTVTLTPPDALSVAVVGNGLLLSTLMQDVLVAVRPVAGKHSLVNDCAWEVDGTASHRAAIASSANRFITNAL